ncbi:MAG: hypothetical protein R3B49_06785 [Phycisphaerales bacterium]
MKTRTARDQLFYVVGVLAPSATVLVARFMGSGPAVASAESLTPPTVVLPQPDGLNNPLAPEVGQAWSAAVAWRDEPLPATPFEPAERIDLSAPNRNGGKRPTPTPGGPRVPEVTVSSIALVAGSPLAVIDGRPCRVGATVAEGWRLDTIDIAKQVIVIRSGQGETATVPLRRP